MSKRKLTKKEILDILNFVTDDLSFREFYEKELREIEIYENCIKTFKKTLKERHSECIIHPGENVGVICAQSIGENFTQSMLNTFHHTGIKSDVTTSCVSRVLRILNCQKRLDFIEYIATYKESLKFLFLEPLYLKDIVISEEKSSESLDWRWLESFRKLFPLKKSIENGSNIIKINLNREVLLERKISPSKFLKLKTFEIDPTMSTLYLKEEDYNKDTLIDGYECLYRVDDKKIITKSNFLQTLVTLPIDKKTFISSNVREILEVLGVEAAREYLIQELKFDIKNVLDSHISLLVDKLSFTGNIVSINRYTQRKENIGVLTKASFEETFHHFKNAAYENETDPCTSSSACIICGKVSKTGTTYKKPLEKKNIFFKGES